MKTIFLISLSLLLNDVSAQSDNLLSLNDNDSTASSAIAEPSAKLFLFRPFVPGVSLPYQSERPTASINPSVIPVGKMMWESGFLHGEEQRYYGNRRTTVYNRSIFRFGLSTNMELRLTSDVRKVTSRFPTFNDPEGLSPIRVGAKIKILTKTKFFSNTAIVGTVGLRKLSSYYFRTPYHPHEVILTSSNNIGKKFNIGYNLGMSWNGSDPDMSMIYALMVGYNATKRLSFFAEAFGNGEYLEDMDLTVDGGFRYVIHPDFQFGASAGYGLATVYDSWFISGGFSWLINFKRS